MLWRYLIRPLFFCLPAETAHHLAMSGFSLSMKLPLLPGMFASRLQVRDSRLNCNLFGIDFPTPVGLAAGFDKNGQLFEALSNLGFSHIEIGTLTAHAQPGNPKPRMFRLPQDKALINRMGFNNQGSEQAALNLVGRTGQDLLGINIGKSKITELDAAAEDYETSFERLFQFANYFTINVSSPNTPGLRKLQNREDLMQIISLLQKRNLDLATDQSVKAKPILLKIAPDLTEEQIFEIAEIALDSKLDGVIATNTTIERSGLETPDSKIQSIGNGGLSGKPLTDRSRNVVALLYSRLNNRIPIVGCGGIMSGPDAWQMIASGASLLQVYTGFIYGGPVFVKDVNQYLLKRLDQHGLGSISDAVGSRL